MPTWLTGALVTARIARSATEAPRKIHTSPVRVSSTASSRVISATATTLVIMRRGHVLKLLGLAGLAGVAATGAVLVRNERQRRAYTPDDVRARLHERAAAPAEQPDPVAGESATAAELRAGRTHRLARLLRRR